MFDIVNYPLFLLTAVTLNLYPGPDTIYILGRSAAQGRAAGIISALGIGTGCVVHTLLGAAGLAALVAASATAYQVIKLAGAAYLVYLGVSMILSGNAAKSGAIVTPQPLMRIYMQGVLTNVLNPKVALVFLALIPQFIASDAAHHGAAFVVLGLTFVATGTTWYLIMAALAGTMHGRLKGDGTGSVWLKRLGGGLLAGLGAKLALSD